MPSYFRPRYDNRIIKPVAYQLVAPEEQPDAELYIFCGAKSCRIGDRVFPFAGLQFYGPAELSSARYRIDGGGWSSITVGTSTDLYQAILRVSYIATEFGTFTYEIELTDKLNNVNAKEVDITCGIKVDGVRVTDGKTPLYVFSNCQLGDVSYIDTIEYSVSGRSAVAKTTIPRTQMFSGTHTGGNDSTVLIDSTKNYSSSSIVVDEDIVNNVTDGSSAVISSVSGNYVYGTLSGGSQNDWDTGESYTIVKGGDLEKVVRRFSITIDDPGIYLVSLHVTDTSANEAVGNVIVHVDDDGSIVQPDDISTLSLWLDFTDITSLYQDAAKTTAVSAEDDPIGAVVDKSDNGYDFTQSNASYKPLYKESENGYGSAYFDGTNDGLERATVAFADLLTSNSGTVFAVVKIDSADATHKIFNLTVSTDSFQIYEASSTLYFDWGDTTNGRISVATPSGYRGTTVPVVVSSNRDGTTNTEAFVNSTEVVEGAMSDTLGAGTATMYLMNDSSITTNPCKGFLWELIIYPTSLSSSKMWKVWNYLFNKYGLD